MKIAPTVVGSTLVLLGKFNPTIIQPVWLAANNLIGKKEAEGAQIDAVFRELSHFSIPERFDVSVTLDRFAISSLSPQPEVIKDLFVSLFGQLLPHTPATGLGINMTVHFECASSEARDRLRAMLAPAEPWGAWLKSPNNSAGVMRVPNGMMSLSMRKDKPQSGYGGYVLVRVEPSIANPEKGIYIDVNDHYELFRVQEERQGEGRAPADGAIAAQALESSWQDSCRDAKFIIDQIMQSAEQVSH